MKADIIDKTLAPEGITFSAAGTMLTVKGPKGEASYNFSNPLITLDVKPEAAIFSAKKGSKREKALIFAYRAHMKNLIRGVQRPYVYLLKICSGHFPMNVSISGTTLSIKNFLGEKVPRTMTFPEGASVKMDDGIITVESTSKELAGRIAGRIELLTKVTGRDRRVFQDGIYIIKKDDKGVA